MPTEREQVEANLDRLNKLRDSYKPEDVLEYKNAGIGQRMMIRENIAVLNLIFNGGQLNSQTGRYEFVAPFALFGYCDDCNVEADLRSSWATWAGDRTPMICGECLHGRNCYHTDWLHRWTGNSYDRPCYRRYIKRTRNARTTGDYQLIFDYFQKMLNINVNKD